MRNPLLSSTGRHFKVGGTVEPLQISVLSHEAAVPLLQKTKRQGIYRPYVPHILKAIQALKDSDHIAFHVPVIKGKDGTFTAKHLMSVLNYALMKSKIPHRLRYVADENKLVSEKVEWK